MATAMPVFPDVASTTVSPGLRSPSFSAFSMMARARRSLTEESGLKYSHLAFLVTPGGQSLSEILTTGVLPMVAVMSSYRIPRCYCRCTVKISAGSTSQPNYRYFLRAGSTTHSPGTSGSGHFTPWPWVPGRLGWRGDSLTSPEGLATPGEVATAW